MYRSDQIACQVIDVHVEKLAAGSCQLESEIPSMHIQRHIKNKEMKPEEAIVRIGKYKLFPHQHQNLIPLLIEFASRRINNCAPSDDHSAYSLVFDAELKLTKRQHLWSVAAYAILIIPATLSAMACLWPFIGSTHSESVLLPLSFGLMSVVFAHAVGAAVAFLCTRKTYTCVNVDSTFEDEFELGLFVRMTYLYELLELLPAFMKKDFPPCSLGRLNLAAKERMRSLAEQIQQNVQDNEKSEELRTELNRIIDLAVHELMILTEDPKKLYKEAFPETVQRQNQPFS